MSRKQNDYHSHVLKTTGKMFFILLFVLLSNCQCRDLGGKTPSISGFHSSLKGHSSVPAGDQNSVNALIPTTSGDVIWRKLAHTPKMYKKLRKFRGEKERKNETLCLGVMAFSQSIFHW